MVNWILNGIGSYDAQNLFNYTLWWRYWNYYWLDQLLEINLKFEKQENLRLVWSLQCSTIGWLLVVLSLVMQEKILSMVIVLQMELLSTQINAGDWTSKVLNWIESFRNKKCKHYVVFYVNAAFDRKINALNRPGDP
jgi:hypothetical protein